MASPNPEKDATTLKNSDIAQMSKVERLKAESEGLFHVSDPKKPRTFRDEVDALSRGDEPTLSNNAKELSKFSGIYKQWGRDERGGRTNTFFFMARIKCPAGGELSPAQWQALDTAADQFADGTIRLTSRQAIQYHHIDGTRLAGLMRHLNREYREGGTLGACGDVNRNVMCSPIDGLDPEDDSRTVALAEEIAEALAPRTSSYFQIWLSDEDGHKLAPVNSEEPLYGRQYLPRKFKIGIGHPDDNSVDLLTQDIGYLPVRTNGRSDGSLFDLYSGGGLGLTHNNPKTAAHLGPYLGRIPREQVVESARAIAILQKENGERKDRKQARWKYTIRRLGIDAVKRELRERFGLDLQDAEPQPVPPMRLHLGWHAGRDGTAYCGISIENGRLAGARRQAVREAVETLGLGVRLTPQHDLLLCGVRDRAAVEAIFARHGESIDPESVSMVRRNAMACPAKPTCGLAMTEAERLLPEYIDAIEQAGFGDVDAVIRMTGCPNNCARPPSAEIGIYGYGKNDHVILIGGSREGTRIARPLYSRLSGEKMVPALVGLFRVLREKNTEGLPVGDFLDRSDPDTLKGWIGVEDHAA